MKDKKKSEKKEISEVEVTKDRSKEIERALADIKTKFGDLASRSPFLSIGGSCTCISRRLFACAFFGHSLLLQSK
jgi:hypothetical protein